MTSIALLISILVMIDGTTHAFDSFEHRYLSEEAFKRVWASQDRRIQAVKADWESAMHGLHAGASPTNTGNDTSYGAVIPLNFGDMAALAGDFVSSPEALEYNLEQADPDYQQVNPWSQIPFADHLYERFGSELNRQLVIALGHPGIARVKAIRRQWDNACSWALSRRPIAQASSLATCLSEAVGDLDSTLFVSLQEHKPLHDPVAPARGYQASKEELAELERLPNFVNLAASNKAHFPQYSWMAYINHHSDALLAAGLYHQIKQSEKEHDRGIRFLQHAILSEAFAQHFLHDSYASGHIGSNYEQHKELLQHVHDQLNRIGIRVYLPNPPAMFFSDLPPSLALALQGKSAQGWMAYGDKHLLTPEGTIHRQIVLLAAKSSLQEVVLAAESGSTNCSMCNESAFPMEVRKVSDSGGEGVAIDQSHPMSLGSFKPSERVPPLFTEGWYISSGLGTLTGKTNVPNKSFFNRDSQSAYSVDIGYVRPTSPRTPNYYGFGFSSSPGVRTSIYPFSVGWWFPNEIFHDTKGMYGGLRFNAGFRIDDSNTFLNSTPNQRFLGEISTVLDFGYQFYKPFSLFTRCEIASMALSGPLKHFKTTIDSPIGNGAGMITFGIRLQINGVDR